MTKVFQGTDKVQPDALFSYNLLENEMVVTVNLTEENFICVDPSTLRTLVSVVELTYVPKNLSVHPESFRHYLTSFRDLLITHEDAALTIAKHLSQLLFCTVDVSISGVASHGLNRSVQVHAAFSSFQGSDETER